MLPGPLYHEDGVFVLRAVLHRVRATVLSQVWSSPTLKAEISSSNLEIAASRGNIPPCASQSSFQILDDPLKMSDPSPTPN